MFPRQLREAVSVMVGSLLLLFSASPGRAATMVINAGSNGESYNQGGAIHETDAAIVVGDAGAANIEYRGFLTFEITNVTDTVTAAQLRLRIDAYNNGATSLNFAIYDYTSGAPPTSVIGGNSTARFNDLGCGVMFGSASINSTANPAGSLLTINLNSNAVSAMNTGVGLWMPSGHRFLVVGLAETAGPAGQNARFTSGTGTGINQLAVTTAPLPEPSAGLLVLFGAMLACRTRPTRTQARL